MSICYDEADYSLNDCVIALTELSDPSVSARLFKLLQDKRDWLQWSDQGKRLRYCDLVNILCAQRYEPARDYIIIGMVGSDQGLENHETLISLASSVFTDFVRNAGDKKLADDPFVQAFKPVALKILELIKTKKIDSTSDAQKFLEKMGVKPAGRCTSSEI